MEKTVPYIEIPNLHLVVSVPSRLIALKLREINFLYQSYIDNIRYFKCNKNFLPLKL